IYALRTLRPRGEIAARLATIVGPAEELFWRGLVQAALMRRLGRWRGAIAATLAYGGVHVVTGNFTLFGAATVAGAHWCALYAAGVPLGALVVSHVTWDVWIFLVQPTGAIEVTFAGSPRGWLAPRATRRLTGMSPLGWHVPRAKPRGKSPVAGRVARAASQIAPETRPDGPVARPACQQPHCGATGGP